MKKVEITHFSINIHSSRKFGIKCFFFLKVVQVHKENIYFLFLPVPHIAQPFNKGLQKTHLVTYTFWNNFRTSFFPLNYARLHFE